MERKYYHQKKVNTRSRIRWGITGVFILLIAAIFFDVPQYANAVIDKINFATQIGLPRVPEEPFRLGLDLQGGAHLIYQAEVSGIEAGDRGEAVEGVRDLIERRVNAIGVGESDVRTAKVGENFRINVELPGVTDVNQAINMIGQTPTLEFKEENDTPPRELTTEENAQIEKYNKDAKARAKSALSRVKADGDFETIAKEISEDELSKNNGGFLNFIAPDKADATLYQWAREHSEGDVTAELVENGEGFNILRRGKERDGEAQAGASHILICYLGSRNCANNQFTKEEAYAQAKSVFEEANAGNFAELAKKHSTDPSGQNGGDLGVFGRGMMVKEFEDAVFNAKVGQIIGPVETEFGYHIIYKTSEEPMKEYELWRVLIKTQSAFDILPPPETWKSTGLSGSQLDRAEVVTDPQTGAVQVSLQFDEEGTALFREITERRVGQPVAIFLDGQPISIPTVQTVIPNGRAVITGNFNLDEARLLAQRLNAGALPVPVQLISQQSVGATLGAESLMKSLKAGLMGMLIVVIFMILYYRLPGVLAAIALVMYTALTLAIFKIIGVTLTLAGIAGFILSVGMAVDANVLIFERMKEELKAKKSLKTAVEEGFLRAWTSIRDSNVSTLISCALLIWFGSSFVQGFAVALSIGILISMFTAITITRVMLRFIVSWFKPEANRLFLGANKRY